MGMKLAIIERLKERGDRRHVPDNNFHSLYVKRHQNVRWAAGRACARGPLGGGLASVSPFVSPGDGIRSDWCRGRSSNLLKLSDSMPNYVAGEERGPFS